jgi:hypothetical protein
MRRLINLIRDAIDFFRPLNREDFGEFGVLVRDEDGNMVPMDQGYFDNLKADVDERVEDFWFQKEAEAFAIHGEAILKSQ